MKKKLFSLFFLLAAVLFAFFLHFGNIEGFASSWRAFSNGSTWIPFSPYCNRVVEASKLRRYDATQVVFEDQSLFWKGKGTVVQPILNSDSQLEKLII